MSSSYLDRFRSALPKAQGNQILKRLITKRDSGEIKNLEEFKNGLKKLTAELLANQMKPTFKIYQAIAGQDISSEFHNEMLNRIEDDLDAAFKEADNLDEIIGDHHNVINNVAFKALRYGINELESKIVFYEFISKNRWGFDDALFNTFTESQDLSTSRSDESAASVFYDPRQKELIPIEEDAFKDVIGERIILGNDFSKYIPVKDITWLTNENSIRSELNVEFPDSSISNVIDGKNNTYWLVSIMSKTIRTAGVPLEICLRLGSSQDVNFVEIEPASLYPMVLTQIDYYDPNNTRRTIVSEETTLTAPVRINFSRINTTAFILQFKQSSYRETQFKQRLGESNFHRAILNENNLPVDKDSITDELKDILSSDFILSDVIGLKSNTNEEIKYFEYNFGLDNVRVGFSTFNDRAIFVSSKKEVENPGQVALKTTETRPVQEEGSSSITIEEYTYPAQSASEDAKFYHGSIEYWLLVKFLTDNDYLVSADIIPILPLGANRIYHERLIFTYKSSDTLVNADEAAFMFYTDADSTDVKVYRNGLLLTYGASEDWDFVATDNPTDITHTTPGDGHPMRRGIQIMDTVRPLDIYTASYTPKVSNTVNVPSSTALLNVTDLIGDQSARMITNNLIVFGTQRLGYPIVKAQMYLMIIMRRNSANLNSSPAVEEYMLVTGSRNQDKFGG